MSECQTAASTSGKQIANEGEKCSRCEFLIEEYKALRKEIEVQLAEVRSLERYTLVAVGAIWGWLSANRIRHPVPWLIPLILTAGVGLRGISMLVHFRRMSRYISEIESAFDVNGWEHRLGAPPWWITASTMTLWYFLIFACWLAFQYRLDLLVPLSPGK